MRAQTMEAILINCRSAMRIALDHSLNPIDTAVRVDFEGIIEDIDAVLDRGQDAGVAKLVDAVGLGPAAARRGGSSPSARTKQKRRSAKPEGLDLGSKKAKAKEAWERAERMSFKLQRKHARLSPKRQQAFVARLFDPKVKHSPDVLRALGTRKMQHLARMYGLVT